MSFERNQTTKNTQNKSNLASKTLARGVGRDNSRGIGVSEAVDLGDISAPLGKNNPDEGVGPDVAPVMGGVQSRETKLGGAFYLAVDSTEPAEAWEKIVTALKEVSVTDTTVKSDESYVAYSMKYFQNTYALARSMLCYIDGEEDLKLEINRHAGDGFGFADLFVKEFSGAVGDLCSQPVFVEDPHLETAIQENREEEFLDLAEEVGGEMVEHWLTSLRPSGGVKYDDDRIYEALSSLGWNCQDERNYAVLKEYSSDIITPVFEIFLRQQSLDHIPSVYYGSLILKQFAEGGDIDMNNTTVASICAIAIRYCDPGADSDSKNEITTSQESLQLLFTALETIAPQIPPETERDEDMLDAMTGFLNKASQMFGDDSMDVRIQQLASALNVEIEEVIA